MDGVVVFEAEERRFARAIKVGTGADASGGRTAEVLKVAASGRGVVPVVMPSGCLDVEERGEARDEMLQ